MPVSSTGPATGFDIVAYRGDTFERWLQVLRNGVEETLAGQKTYLLQIKSGAQLIKQLNQPSDDGEGYKIDSPNAGVLKFTITAASMADIPAGSYDYDLQQRDIATERVKTFIRGKFTITDDISRYQS